MKLRLLRRIGCGLLVVFVLVPFFILPTLLYFVPMLTSKNPPRPAIEYGEFPFRVEYEIHGEVIVVEDTVICEFDGFDWNAGEGKVRVWKSRLASGSKTKGLTMLTIDDTHRVYCTIVAEPRYYMDDSSPINPNISPAILIEDTTSWTSMPRVIPDDELLEQYGIRLISWEMSAPIVNGFE